LNLNSTVKTITKVEIYSVIGKKVIEFNQGLEKMNIEELSSGLYVIKVIANEASFTTKFIKE
jgi:endo-1,3(4)-beta-glucanase